MSNYRRKLIEVALPLEAINVASAREKSIRHGHPSTLHTWWSRKPLAACRAVLFASLVDDPSEYCSNDELAIAERERLFKIIEDLVLWENTNNQDVLDKARLEIARSVARDQGVDVPVGKKAIRDFLATQAPPILDPFAGGGSIPLEAQRLGLRTYASDLNPVAVLINKALIEIPPKFESMPPVHPTVEGNKDKGNKGEQVGLWKIDWKNAEGLAEDVRYYGQWMRDEAYKRVGHLYPAVKITDELLVKRPDLKAQGLKPGYELAVIAWLWARTVKCPNPACGVQLPLTSKWWLSAKKGREVWIQPVVDRHTNPPHITLSIKVGNDAVSEGTVKRNGARCIACETPIPFEYIREEGKSGRLNSIMLSVVAETPHGRVHIHPGFYRIHDLEDLSIEWAPEFELPNNPRDFKTPNYGMQLFSDLFTDRQLVMLNTFSNLVEEARKLIVEDAKAAGFSDDQISLEEGGVGAIGYADAVSTYLAEAVSKLATFHNTIAYWRPKENKSASGFGRQALPMTWDYVEINPFAGAGGDFQEIATKAAPNVISQTLPAKPQAEVYQSDATLGRIYTYKPVICTDPPYYDNISYADLSDYFYLWLRRSLQNIYPRLFATMLTPKKTELVATQFRFDSDKEKAKVFFESGLLQAFGEMHHTANQQFPIVVFYAFKQSESEEDSDNDMELYFENRSSTGWETMLEGLLKSGFQITGTWPMRTENPTRMLATGGGGMNVLASSIVLVCRPRHMDNLQAIKREFVGALKRELPPALRQLQQGSIAPVDLAQAAIGPGMAVFSRYKQVLEADGSPMGVRTALGLINLTLDEFLAEQEGEYDSDTRWALAWYEQFGHEQGPYGVAETLSKAKNTSVDGLVEAGFLEARAGKVRLLRREELDPEWDPQKDKRPTAWEACQHLIYDLEKGGEQPAAVLLAKLGSLSETARDLAYRLYTVCERKKWAQEALGYNMLVVAWPRLRELARGKTQPEQGRLL